MLRPLPHRNRLARIFRRDGLPRQNGNQRRLHSRLSADDELRRHAGFRSACKRTAQNVVAGSQRLGRVIRRVKVQNRSRKRGKMMPKYAYTDLDGINRTWTGQGKTPLALLKLMQKTGASLDDFLIKKEMQQSLD